MLQYPDLMMRVTTKGFDLKYPDHNNLEISMFRLSLSSKAKTQLQKTLQQLSIFTPAAAIPTLSFNVPAQGFSQNSTTKVDLVVSGLETPTVNLKGFSFDVLLTQVC